MKKIVEIAKENDLYLNEVMDLSHYQRKKMYYRKYNKSATLGIEELDRLDNQAYQIVERYLKIHSKETKK